METALKTAAKPVTVKKKAKVLPHHQRTHAQQEAQVADILRASRNIQTKLRIGPSDDRFEREADRIAGRIVSAQQAEPLPSFQTFDTVRTSVGSDSMQTNSSRYEEGLQRIPEDETEFDEGLLQAAVQESQQPLLNDAVAARINTLCNSNTGKRLANRMFYENQFGYDFSNTCIHADSAAAGLAESIHARAFTVGNHIIFAAGEYAPATVTGKRLIAHELTHVVQQGAAEKNGKRYSNGNIVQKQSIPLVQAQGEDTEEAIIPDVAGNKRTGLVDRTHAASATITWSQLNIPRFKSRDHRAALYQSMAPLKRGKGRTVDRSGDNDPAQRNKWLREVNPTNIHDGLEEKLRAANAGELPEGDNNVFEVRNVSGQNRYYYGSLGAITREFLTPAWGGTGRRAIPRYFHVDHIVELQLANWPHSSQGNELSNMELLEGNRNQESGRIIRENIMEKINGFINATGAVYGNTPTEIKENFTLVFERVNGSGGPSVRREDYWTRQEIENGEHLRAVVAADPTKIGGPGLVRIFSQPTGGVSRAFNWSGNTTEEQVVPADQTRERDWLKPYVITHKYFKTDPENETEGDNFGYLRVHIPPDHGVFEPTEPVDLRLSRFAGARYGGALPGTVRTTINRLNADAFSPVVFDQVEVFGDRGIVAEGNIDVTLPFFSDNTQIGIRLEDGNLDIFKEFTIDDINVPDPFDISACSLLLAYNLQTGWRASGNVDFAIEGVGDGRVTAGVGEENGFFANGEFNFESMLFNPAHLAVGYHDGEWTINGNVGIGEGLIPGITSAELAVGWAENVLSGMGQIDFSYPWLEGGTLELRQSEESGFSLGAAVGLTGDVPGLRSGTVAMQISKNPEGIWNLGGRIDAELNTESIPGLTQTTFTGQIQNGIFDARLTSAFERDIASGSVTVGVTNQAVDEEGQPVEGEATEELVFYGDGNVSLQLTPWLAASAGVLFDCQGAISVEGGIEVTEDIEILSDEQTPDFELPRARRPSFDVNIPLVTAGVADVALDLGGELNAYLRTSPLILTDVRLEVFYAFDDPQATRIEGHARLHMDAQAGLSGTLELGLSARVLVLRGGGRIALTVGAELDGNLDLTTQPSWNIQDGFAIDADLDVIVQPVIYVSLDGYLYAEIDVLIGSIEVWESDRLNLADERLPLNLRLGATADAHYREKPRNELTYSGINWVVPTADEMENALVDLVRDKV